ncbi:hypothetical protein ABPG74_006839 [Tetrahymena malaccensis]
MEIEHSTQNPINLNQNTIFSYQNKYDFNQIQDYLDENCYRLHQQDKSLNRDKTNNKSQLQNSQKDVQISQIHNQCNKKDEGKQKNKLKTIRQVTAFDIYRNLNCENTIKLAYGLQIEGDGIIRFSHGIGFLSFGYGLQSIQSLQHLKYNKLLQQEYSAVNSGFVTPIPIALEHLKRNYEPHFYNNVYEALKIYEQGMYRVIEEIQQLNFTQQLLEEHNQQFQLHIKLSEEYLQEYSMQNQCQIFTYSIGRINIQRKDAEIIKCGFSTSFLDLIGINNEIFEQMLFRNQKIDLIQNRNDIQGISIKAIQNIFILNSDQEHQFADIVTFDGFPIQISIKKKKIQPHRACKKFLNVMYEFMFYITEIDIDFHELQKLILYRERLVKKNDNLSFEDFIKKELSFLFEDVEYSVYSQQFLEKYYQTNIQKLKMMQKQYRCGYKIIKQN